MPYVEKTQTTYTHVSMTHLSGVLRVATSRLVGLRGVLKLHIFLFRFFVGCYEHAKNIGYATWNAIHKHTITASDHTNNQKDSTQPYITECGVWVW